MSRRPGAPRSLAHSGLAAWLLASLVAAPPWLPAVQAAPKGEKVVKGKATFTREGDVTVIRTGKRAIIEYEGFDILSHETVRFEQPSQKSRVLNRVGGDATRIDGNLQANGIVYIVNPSGVFFGRTAVVDVKRLVAAAGDLPDRAFLKNVDRFSLTGPVESRGAIEASSVALLGTSVANHGEVVAPKGLIALVAGERVVLTRLEGGISIEVDGAPPGVERGIDQSGLVDAAGGTARFAVGDHYSLAINHAGVTRAQNIALEGGDGGLVKVAGTLDASAPAPGETGGSVRVSGELVQLEGAQLDASGAAGGGEIRVGGDVRGQGPMRNARRTHVDGESALRADALVQGDGGSAVVYAEEAAAFHGEISARGGAAGGDGGFAELSSEGVLVDEGRANLRAPAGKSGTLLYDPQDIQIVGGTPVTGDGSDTPNTSPDELAQGSAGQILFGDVGEGGAEPFLIYESEIEGTDANIVLEARNSITVAAGSTFDNDSGEGAGVVAIRSGNDLTMRTRNNGAVPASGTTPAVPADDEGSAVTPGIDLTGSAHGADLAFRTFGDGAITMRTGTGTVEGPEAPIAIGILGTQGGNVSISTADGSITVASVDTSGQGGDTGGDAGEIVILAADRDLSDDTAIVVTGSLTARGGDGTTGAGGDGGNVGIATAFGGELDGGGDVTLMGAIDASGGSGPGGGGNGGPVVLRANGVANLSAGAITTTGGDAQDVDVRGNGGRGGNVELRTASGDIAVGAIDTRGGDTDGAQTEVVDGEIVPSEFAGRGGDIRVDTGIDTNGVGGLTLNGNLDLRGGDNLNPVFLEDEGDGAGGTSQMFVVDAIEHGGQAGPHITTQGNVIFNAEEVGAVSPIFVSGGGTKEGLLGLGADGVARVVIDEGVGEGTFNNIQVVAFSNTSDMQVVEGAQGEIIRIQGTDLVRLDSSVNNADVTVGLQDRLDGTQAPNADLKGGLLFRLRTGSINAGGHVRVTSEDDIVVGDGPGVVAVMNTRPPDPDADPDDPQPPTSGVLMLIADAPQGQFETDEDQVGGITSAAGALLNLTGDAEEAGGLLASSFQGIGTAANPIGTQGGGPVALLTQAPLEGKPPGEGIFLRNEGGGVLTTDLLTPPGAFGINGVRVVGTAGDIVLENTAGDVQIEAPVTTRGDIDGLGGVNGQDGTVTLRAGPGAAVRLASQTVTAVESGGNIHFASPVQLNQNSIVRSRGGDIDFDGSIDTDPALEDPVQGARVRSLIVSATPPDAGPGPGTGTITLGGDVGAVVDLRNVTFSGNVVLEGGARSVHVTDAALFTGDIDADSQDSASLTVLAGRIVGIGGDIGATEANGASRLLGFSAGRNEDPPFAGELGHPLVSFLSETPGAAQQVVTGAGGIAFAARPEVPESATVAKVDGSLTLQSTGAVSFGQNQKLTAQGDVVIAGDTVQLGDVSALTLDVTSVAPNGITVLRRDPGQVLLRSGGRTRDEGTDLVANEIAFSSTPVIGGTGSGSVRVMTPDGVATNAESLEPVALRRGIAADDMLRGTTVLDLTALPTDLPNEVPQPGPEVSGPAPLHPSQETASGSALPPGAEETLAYLRCAATEPRSACDVVPASPLDSPRGAELAHSASQLLGDGPEAVARREALARLDPRALRELAVFLTEVRLLGLSEPEYRAVRDSLFGEILAGAAAPDAGALAKAVQGQSRGVPL